MANAKKSAKQSKEISSEEETEQEKARLKIFAFGDTPIVITGGSVNLSYANETTGDLDKFDDDAAAPDFPPNGKPKKRLTHRKNPTLQKIVIADKTDPTVVFQVIDLEQLQIQKKCRIMIYYR